MKLVLISNSKEATFLLGELIANLVKPSSVLALDGGLGAGKTKLSSGIAKGLKCQEELVSPTFTILRDYEINKQYGNQDGYTSTSAEQLMPIYHMDAYRLKDYKEFEQNGFDEYFDRGGLTIVEWAEIIEEVLPKRTIRINFNIEDKNENISFDDFLRSLENEAERESAFLSQNGGETNDTNKGNYEDDRPRIISISADEDFCVSLKKEIKSRADNDLYVKE